MDARETRLGVDPRYALNIELLSWTSGTGDCVAG
jgi:hypothetical protein